MQPDRRAFLEHLLGATGAGVAIELLAACTPSPTGSGSANKQEVIAITAKTMQVGDGLAQNAYDLHIGQKVPAQDLHINEAFMQQFVANQKRIGEGREDLPLDPMRYVDATPLQRGLHA